MKKKQKKQNKHDQERVPVASIEDVSHTAPFFSRKRIFWTVILLLGIIFFSIVGAVSQGGDGGMMPLGL